MSEQPETSGEEAAEVAALAWRGVSSTGPAADGAALGVYDGDVLGRGAAVIGDADSLAGTAPAAWLGSAAVVVAEGMHPLQAEASDALVELVQARDQLSRLSTLVTRAVAMLPSNGHVPGGLATTVHLTARAVERVDGAAAALMAS